MNKKSIINFLTNRLNSGLEEDDKLASEEITELLKEMIDVKNSIYKMKKKKKNNLYEELMLLVKIYE